MYSTVQYYTVLYSTLLYWTVLYSTAQYLTVLYNSVQYCTVNNQKIAGKFPGTYSLIPEKYSPTPPKKSAAANIQNVKLFQCFCAKTCFVKFELARINESFLNQSTESLRLANAPGNVVFLRL